MVSSENNSSVHRIVYSIIMLHQEKTVIKLSDIKKLAGISTEISKHNVKKYINEAASELAHLFGYRLCCLKRFQKPNCYILINQICDNLLEHTTNKMKLEFYELLYCVLGLITMTMNPINEITLTNFLRQLINKPEKFQYFSNGENSMNQFLKDAIKQMYLVKIVDLIDDTKTITYDWGCRAILEVKRLDVLNFVSMVYNVSPELWGEIYKKCIQLDLEESKIRLEDT